MMIIIYYFISFFIMDYINPFDSENALSFFISKQQFINKIQIALGGYYNYFKKAYIVDVHKLILHDNNDIKTITVYPSSSHFYSNLRLTIGKYYYISINKFHKFIINNIEINIYDEVINYDELIKEHSILFNNTLTLYPTQYLELQQYKNQLSNNLHEAKILYSKIIKNQINKELIDQLNIEQYNTLFKICIFRNDINIINLLKDNNKVKYLNTSILEYLMVHKFELFISFKDLNNYLDDNGFNLLEYAIINKHDKAIEYLKQFTYDRISYYIEVSYNTNYITYNEDDKLITKDIIPKKVKNCKLLNSMIIDEMLNHGIFDNTYDYIIHHLKYFDYSLLCDMLVRNHASLTVKLLLKNNILEFNKYTIIMLIKLHLEDLNNNEQKEVFLNYSEVILNMMINDEEIWKRFKEHNYLKMLNSNFIVNNNYDNILHLLIRCTYKSFHDDILNYVININKEVINNVNSRNENCIFEMNNEKIINKIFVIGVENKQNIYGDYYIHHIIKHNKFNLLISMLKVSDQQINLQNTYNETALILSCKLKDINTINYLLNTNCDKNITDCYGNTFSNYTQLYGLNVKTNNKYTYNNKSLDYLINYIITQY